MPGFIVVGELVAAEVAEPIPKNDEFACAGVANANTLRIMPMPNSNAAMFFLASALDIRLEAG